MRRVALVILLVVLALGVGAHRADALPGLPDPCDLAPSGPLSDACHVAQGVTNPVGAISGVGGLVGDAAGVAGVSLPSWSTDPIGAMAQTLADTLKGALDGLGGILSSAPEPPVDQAWFKAEYAPLAGAGITLSFLLFGGLAFAYGVRGRLADMSRSFVLMVVAVFLSATAPLFVKTALMFADALTTGLASAGGQPAGQLTDKLTDITTAVTQTGNLGDTIKPFALVLILFVTVVFTLLWMVLLIVRTDIIYVATLAIPFVLPSIIDGKGRVARFYFRALFCVILAKPVLLGTVVAGAILLRDGYVGQAGWVALVTGMFIVVFATLFPLAVFKLLLPAAAPIVLAVERGGGKVISHARTGAAAVAGFAVGGPAGAAVASASSPKTPPPRPRSPT